MSYHAPNEAAAHRAAASLNARRPDESSYEAAGRPTSKYIVEKYATPFGQYGAARSEGRFEYGVVRRWIYSDRPELGEFGGAFEMLRGSDYT